MNIGSLNFNLQQIKPLHFNGKNTNASTLLAQKGCDTFVKSTQNKNPFEGQMSYKTYEEAKKAVLKSLQYAPQKESAALVQGDKIVYFAEGKERKVEVDNKIMDSLTQNSSDKIIFIHSHPQINGVNRTLPLSLTDFLLLYTNDNLSAICAVGKNGEYSILKKKPGFEPDIEKLSQIHHRFNVAMAEIFEGKEKEEYEAFLKLEEKMLNGEDINVPFSELIEKSKHFTDIIEHSNCSKALDNFWKNVAEEYGLEYSSNYGF